LIMPAGSPTARRPGRALTGGALAVKRLRRTRSRRGGTARLLRRWRLRPLEVRAAGSKWRAGAFEFAARAHREHRRSFVDDPEFAIATAMMPTAVPAGMRAEEEAGEEDDGDDEDDARNDADPSSHRGESAVAWRLRIHRWRGIGRWCGGRHRAGCRFRGRRCFAHESEDASGVDAPVLNWL
jgi:hypothetical protein